MDAATTERLKRGEAIRAVLQQIQYAPMPVADQIVVFLATNAGLLDDIPANKIIPAQEVIIKAFHQHFSGALAAIARREKLTEETQKNILTTLQKALGTLK